MKKVTVIIDEAGETHVELEGFHGNGCEAVLKAFGAGADAKGPTHKKPEFYQRAKEVQKQ